MKFPFSFSKIERRGVFFLLLLIFVVQSVSFLFNSYFQEEQKISFSLTNLEQLKIDSLKQLALRPKTKRIYPFNPNYISDFKGYTLGLSPKEIDRLHSFREENSYVNSAKEFQEVTKVSDSLLAILSPYFKFPNWTEKAKSRPEQHKKNVLEPKDINSASAQELMKIKGIGEVLSKRIIKFRDRLGGFLVNEQLYDVYGLEKEVAYKVLKEFKVINPPIIKKININQASSDEIATLVYIKRVLAERIVAKRKVVGTYQSFDELLNIQGFPKGKIERIALYLSL